MVVAEGVRTSVPEVFWLPLHAVFAGELEAVQDLAVGADHVSVLLLPATTVVGLAIKETVGANTTAETFTVTDCEADPPLPVQLNEYVVVTVGETLTEPDVELAVKPLPVQDVALVDDQLRVLELPLIIEVELALSETMGAWALTEIVVDCVALSPPLVHVIIYVVVTVGDRVTVPEVGSLPLQVLKGELEAVQDIAFKTTQVITELSPAEMVLKLGVMVIVGTDKLAAEPEPTLSKLPPQF